MPVYRWRHDEDLDWISVPDGGEEPTADQLTAWGYRREPEPQFYAYLIGTEAMVPVYRWWHPVDRDWVSIPGSGDLTDEQMTEFGYVQKTFQFFAHAVQVPGTVPVFRWWHEEEKDWVTIAEGELSDQELSAAGYTKFPTPLFYVFRSRPKAANGYFPLGPAATVMKTSTWGAPDAPHTMSVIDRNSEGGGFRYWGYYGLQVDGGIGIAKSNDLVNWTQVPGALFSGHGERWPSVLLVDGHIYMAHTVDYLSLEAGNQIVLRHSTDGENFSPPISLVDPHKVHRNQNPALFRDPVSLDYFLYWFHGDGLLWEIRVKRAPTPEALATAPSHVLAWAPITLAAPQVLYHEGTYYMAVETEERGKIWHTRVLTSEAPDHGFVEVPGNPILGNGGACFFQHTFDNKLHAYFCKLTGNVWTLDHLSADLTAPS